MVEEVEKNMKSYQNKITKITFLPSKATLEALRLGFFFECDENNFAKVTSWKSIFEPYLIHSFVKGHTGSDINPLTSNKMVKVGLKPDLQRYFDYHHAANDTFDGVNKRELELEQQQ